MSSTPSGNPGSSAAVRPGSSRNISGVAPGAASAGGPQHRVVRALTALAATAKARSPGTPTACSAKPSVTGPVSWILNGATPPGDGVQEGPQGHERLAVDPAAERPVGIDRRLVHQQGAVRQDLHAVDAPGGLGDHPLDRGPPGQGRRRRQAGLAVEHERDGLARVVVRQAPDRRREPDGEEHLPHGSATRGSTLLVTESPHSVYFPTPLK